MPHRFVLVGFFALVALAALAACGGGTASGDLDKLQVTLSQFAVTVTNTSGQVLTEVVAEINPTSPATAFSVGDFPWDLTEWAPVDWGRPNPDFRLRPSEVFPYDPHS